MLENYGRDLDLNLLRVFLVVAESASVTQAASRLYLTQPAVSAALRRLQEAIGVPLFVRRGRGLALTARGRELEASARIHVRALVEAALAPPLFDPATSDRTLRLGVSDAAEVWLLPQLLHELARAAPRMRLIALPVNFRTVGDRLAGGDVDLAISVADELPATIRRAVLYRGTFACIYDPRKVAFRRLTEAAYYAHEHVIVSYNGDLRGVVEDMGYRPRTIRCSVASFTSIGPLIDGSGLLATVPVVVARAIVRERPHLATAALPVRLGGGASELLWSVTTDDDAPCRFARAQIMAIGARTERELAAPRYHRVDGRRSR